jgi:hypothetical protein
MTGLDCVDAASVTGADIADLTRLTQKIEASTGLVDMTAVRLTKLFESHLTRRGCVLYESGSPVGWVAVRVDGCTGVLTSEQSVFASESATLRSAVANALVEKAVGLAAEVGASSVIAGTSVKLRFEAPRADSVISEALTSHGARVVNHWKRIRADIDEALRRLPGTPPNVEVRRVETEEDFAVHHRIRNVGYGQVPGDRMLTLGQWRDQLNDEPGCAPDSWMLAYLDGEPVGMYVSSLSRAELGAVYLSHSATLPGARNAGCQTALNRSALTWGLAQGLTWSRSRRVQRRGPAVGEVDNNGFSAVDYLDVWEMIRRRS